MKKGQVHRDLRMSVLEVSDEVTSIPSRICLTFQDNLEELPFEKVARGLAWERLRGVDG